MHTYISTDLQVVNLHEEFLTSVNRTLVTEYKILNDSIYENELKYVIIL